MTPVDRRNAHVIVSQALQDEITNGAEKVILSQTLACFLEYRIAEALAYITQNTPNAVELPPRWDMH